MRNILKVVTLLLLASSCSAQSESTKNLCSSYPENQDYALFNKLIARIENGDAEAFSYALGIRNCFDGGNLGDFLRAGGLFFELDPKLFLDLVHKGKLSESDIYNMLPALPLTSVDDIPLQIQITEKRISIIKELGGGPLFQASLKALRRELEQLRSLDSGS
jgi:hypothetical protein